MRAKTEFKLPDVGEGLTEAEVVSWMVAVGDTVAVNDVLCEIETAKSVVELPSPVAGVISALHFAEGETVDVGSVLVTIGGDTAEDAPAPGPVAGTVVEDDEASDPAAGDLGEIDDAADEEKPLILVGTGPAKAVHRKRRLTPRDRREVGGPAASAAMAQLHGRGRAKPPVRALARRLGVDLATITPQQGHEVTRHDVELAASQPPVSRVLESGAPATRETRTAVKGVRKVTATAMTTSAFTAPHVTEWLTVDVSATMAMVRGLKTHKAWAGHRVTPLLCVARAFLLAVRKYPEINARWDEAAQEIVQYHYVNLGIAAATPRGLIVPNIKDAHAMDLITLAASLDNLVTTARSGRTSPEEMSRGTITITNIGALGVDAGTPILNLGEAAILAFGAVRPTPWVVDGKIEIREVTQLAMSFDHRLVDGELGSNVLAETGHLLNDPGGAFLY